MYLWSELRHGDLVAENMFSWELSSLIDNHSEILKRQEKWLFELIATKRPNKIVEIGIRAGSRALKCFEARASLGLDFEYHAVDSVARYRIGPNTLNVGFLLDKAFDEEEGLKSVLSFHPETVAPQVMEEIGKGVDFLILDTGGVLPGETLDLICSLPYLSDGCTVVLFKTEQNMEASYRFLPYKDALQFANKLIWLVATGRRIGNENASVSGMKVFEVTQDTRDSAGDLFSLLTGTWYQVPEDRYLGFYKESILKHYALDQYDYFCSLVGVQSGMIDRRNAHLIRMRERKEEAAYYKEKLANTELDEETVEYYKKQIAYRDKEIDRMRSELHSKQ